MIGALAGDCIGGFWEITGNLDPQVSLWTKANRFIDDSVCTGETVRWLLESGNYAQTLHINLDCQRKTHIFDVSCEGTVPLAIAIAYHSSFVEAAKRCCSLGGDADTWAAICGPICEIFYSTPSSYLINTKNYFEKEDNIWNDVLELYNKYYFHPVNIMKIVQNPPVTSL